jgi:hypothetical protein
MNQIQLHTALASMGDSKYKLYDWVKLALDNKLLIFAILSFFGSAAGNISQAVDIDKKDKQMKMLGESYATIVYQHQDNKPIDKPKPTGKTVYINRCADECQAIMDKHIDEFH